MFEFVILAVSVPGAVPFVSAIDTVAAIYFHSILLNAPEALPGSGYLSPFRVSSLQGMQMIFPRTLRLLVSWLSVRPLPHRVSGSPPRPDGHTLSHPVRSRSLAALQRLSVRQGSL